ncbi:hypothetical protein JCM11641_001249 [Rhodosporidiobolus odoratus]
MSSKPDSSSQATHMPAQTSPPLALAADQDKLSQFVSLTSASQSQAHFFLDSAHGDLELAVASFFESGQQARDDDDHMNHDDDMPGAFTGAAAAAPPVPAVQPQPQLPQTQQSGAYTLSGAPAEPLPAGWGLSAGSVLPSCSQTSFNILHCQHAPSRSSTSTSSAFPSSSSSSSASSSRNPPALRGGNSGPRVTGFHDLASGGSGSAPKRSGGGSKFSSFSAIRDREDEARDDGDVNDPTNFYTGGAKSGLSVENPDRPEKENPGGGPGGGIGDMLRGILQQAREGSQRALGRESAEREGGAGAAGASWFGGNANTLGSDETPSAFIPDPSRPQGGNGDEDEEDEEEEGEELPLAIRHLTFWQDGFSIEDGDLMRYEENQEMLAAIQSGRAPLSLLRVATNQRVELRIAERRSEKWTRQPGPPKGKWEGGGNRLGSEAPTFTSTTPVAAPAASSSEEGGARTESGASVGGQTVFEVDRNEPTTQIQIRLRSGDRMIATFNLTHTVADIRQYINNSSPAHHSTPYILQTTFPTRDLDDEKKTIDELGLKGSVVVQRAA